MITCFASRNLQGVTQTTPYRSNLLRLVKFIRHFTYYYPTRRYFYFVYRERLSQFSHWNNIWKLCESLSFVLMKKKTDYWERLNNIPYFLNPSYKSKDMTVERICKPFLAVKIERIFVEFYAKNMKIPVGECNIQIFGIISIGLQQRSFSYNKTTYTYQSNNGNFFPIDSLLFREKCRARMKYAWEETKNFSSFLWSQSKFFTPSTERGCVVRRKKNREDIFHHVWFYNFFDWSHWTTSSIKFLYHKKYLSM